MQTLQAGSFLNLENAASVEALKFTARRLAEHSGSVVKENLNAQSLENLANNLWQKAEYVTRETERRRLQQIFVENFSERFRELKPESERAEVPNFEVLPTDSACSNTDSVEKSATVETFDRAESAATESVSPMAALTEKSATVAEGKTDEFLGFVKTDDSFNEASADETEIKVISTAEIGQTAVQSKVTISETAKTENQTVAVEMREAKESDMAAKQEVSTESLNAKKSQPTAATTTTAKNNLPAASANKAPAATDEKEPFEFGKCTVNLNLVLLPSYGSDKNRKAIISATSHTLPPEIEFLEIADGEDLAQIAELVKDKLARFQQTLPVKYIEQLRASKTKTAKTNQTVKTASPAPKQIEISRTNTEKPSGEQKSQNSGSMADVDIKPEETTEKVIDSAMSAPVSTVPPTVAVNNVQPSLF